MNTRAVGILGGMGPEATVLLMQKVIKAVPARDDADHVALIVHQNPSVPSRIGALIDRRESDPGPALARMAVDLKAAGAAALAMPCNTAHHYVSSIKDACDLPFLDMLALSAAALSRGGARRIGVLASPAVRLSGVLLAPFAVHGLGAVFPDAESPLLALIRAVKSGNPPDAALLNRAAQKLMHRGCDHILVACSELSLLTGGLPADLPWTDSLDCLTKAIVGFARGEG